MKATILGTDLLNDNNSVKLLEMNTNAAIYNSGAQYLDYDLLFNVLVSNNITEFHFIYTDEKSAAPNGSSEFVFETRIKEKCTEFSIEYTAHTVPIGSVTVPSIEDAPNKFILRQAYDTSALVDSTYCADKFEFFSLMSGSSYIPKTYFSSPELSMDTLDSLDINDTSYPNLVEKARYPHYDRQTLPNLSKYPSNDSLDTTKSDLSQNNLLQEFVDGSQNIVDGYWSVIRSIDIIYGSNLDVINLGGYRHSALIPLDFCENEFNENGVDLNKKSRSKYLNKNSTSDVKTMIYHTDEESDILMYDGTTTNVSNIQVGDVIKTVQLDYGDASNEFLPTQTSTLAEISSSLTYVSSSLISSESQEINDFFIKIGLVDSSSWVDTPSTAYVIEESGSNNTRFEFVNKFLVGDKIVTVNKDTNSITTKEISSLDIIFDSKTIYNLDFEPYDYFMVDVNNDEYSIMHNVCTGCSWAACGNYWCDSFCSICAGPPGLTFCFIAGTEISLGNGDVKNIEDVNIKEEVITYNESTGENEIGVVGDLKKHEVNSVIRLTLDNENIITTTEEHPFFVEGKGWVKAGELQPLDVCKKVDGSESLVSTVEVLEETHTVYNLLSVSDNHNFYANGILVHNKK